LKEEGWESWDPCVTEREEGARYRAVLPSKKKGGMLAAPGIKKKGKFRPDTSLKRRDENIKRKKERKRSNLLRSERGGLLCLPLYRRWEKGRGSESRSS